jgi:hypothetical protein
MTRLLVKVPQRGADGSWSQLRADPRGIYEEAGDIRTGIMSLHWKAIWAT